MPDAAQGHSTIRVMGCTQQADKSDAAHCAKQPSHDIAMAAVKSLLLRKPPNCRVLSYAATSDEFAASSKRHIFCVMHLQQIVLAANHIKRAGTVVLPIMQSCNHTGNTKGRERRSTCGLTAGPAQKARPCVRVLVHACIMKHWMSARWYNQLDQSAAQQVHLTTGGQSWGNKQPNRQTNSPSKPAQHNTPFRCWFHGVAGAAQTTRASRTCNSTADDINISCKGAQRCWHSSRMTTRSAGPCHRQEGHVTCAWHMQLVGTAACQHGQTNAGCTATAVHGAWCLAQRCKCPGRARTGTAGTSGECRAGDAAQNCSDAQQPTEKQPSGSEPGAAASIPSVASSFQV